MKGPHRFAVFLAFATFLLVIAGGLVTSTGSALAVPDWPLSYGQFFPRMVGGVRFEHGHRMIAGVIGFLTLLLAIWLTGTRARPAVKRLAWWAVAAVVAQAVLGGVTVILRLPVVIAVAHACLGQIFFSLIVCLAVFTGEGIPFAELPMPEGADKLRKLSYMTTGFIFLQLLAGATYRHSGMGLQWHFLVAALVTTHVVLLARRVFVRFPLEPDLKVPVETLINLLGVQLVLGYFSWRLPSVAVTTAHVAVGALMLATSVVLSVQATRKWA